MSLPQLKTSLSTSSFARWTRTQAQTHSSSICHLHRRQYAPQKLTASRGHNFRDLMLKYLVRTSRNSLHYIWECYSFFLLSRLSEPLPQRPGPWQTRPPQAQLTVQTPNKAALEARPFKRLYEAHWAPRLFCNKSYPMKKFTSLQHKTEGD